MEKFKNYARIAIVAHMSLLCILIVCPVYIAYRNDINNFEVFVIAVVLVNIIVFGASLWYFLTKQLYDKPDNDTSEIMEQESMGLQQEDLIELCKSASFLADMLTKGQLDTRIDTSNYQGGWAILANCLNQMIAAVEMPLYEIATVTSKLREGDFRYRVQGDYQGVFNDMSDSLNTTLDEISAYVQELQKVLDGIGEGNLQHKITREYVGSFDLIKRSVNSILMHLSTTMEDIETVATGVSGGAERLSQSSSDLAVESTEQMLSLKELAIVLGEVDDRSKANVANAQKAFECAKISIGDSETGNTEMKRLLDAMESITSSVSKIYAINKTIDTIAFQTKLLALNASIEAAHAGKHGRGFAVVAEEVRNLAVRAGEAAKQSAELTREVTDSINNGRVRANDTAGSLDKIVSTVVEVSNVVGDIFKASLRQTMAISDINRNLLRINEGVHENVSTSEEAAKAAEELTTQVTKLQDKLAFFQTRLAMPKISEIWMETTVAMPELVEIDNVHGTKITYSNDDIIIRENVADDGSMYFILDGSVNVYKAYGKANETLLATLKSGDLFGEMSLFLNEPRTATVVSVESVTVIEFKKEHLHELLIANPDVTYSIVETLCARLRNMLLVLDAY